MGRPLLYYLGVTACLRLTAARWFLLSAFGCITGFWLIIRVVGRIKAVLLADGDAMAGAAGYVARRCIELVGQLSDALNDASLPGYGLAHFPIIAIHLYFTARNSRLGGQARDDAVG